MNRLFSYFLLFCCTLFHSGNAQESPEEGLFRDLMIVDYVNQCLNDRMPVYYNHLLYGGYFNMPSARMGEEGELGIGFTYVPPYHIYNLRCQLLDRLEISGSYRVFRGLDDPILTPHGFGDLSDKGANVKFALWRPEDSNYKIPGIAIGFEDFLGTRSFVTQYIVLTHVFKELNLEVTLGYGHKRIRRFFGGFHWMPFRNSPYCYLRSLSFAAEYDATPYEDPDIEKHPKGRVKKSPINFGLKYRLWDHFDFSLSYIRGHELACSVSSSYNFGFTKGFITKCNDPLPYSAPVNNQVIGYLRPEDVFMQELYFAFQEQGFDLLDVQMHKDECGQQILRLKIINDIYRLEYEVRNRLNYLLSAVIPSDIDHVWVVIDAEGFPVQEYHFSMPYVRRWSAQEICNAELRVLSPLKEVSNPCFCENTQLFKKNLELWNIELLPRTHTFFGSASGKFKYTIGLNLALDGFIFNSIYYTVMLGYPIFMDLERVAGVDRLNPSQIINVRSDSVLYFKHRSLTVDQAFLQKAWNMGKGFYSRVALGYFEEAYAGLAGEFLYYPVNCPWAIGIEGAVIKKREYQGLGLTSKIRKYDGFQLTHKKFLGSQYFLDVYYHAECINLEFRVKVGKFLANDWGIRNEISRLFPSGLRLSFWFTYTNAHDKINGQRYHDKGLAITMPLDIFYTHSERKKWHYGMSAWMRDVGAEACTGKDLYNMIRDLRD